MRVGDRKQKKKGRLKSINISNNAFKRGLSFQTNYTISPGAWRLTV